MAAVSFTNVLNTLAVGGLNALRDNIVLAATVNRERESELTTSQKNGTVNIIIPSAVTTNAVTPGPVPPTDPTLTPTTKSLQLTEWQEAPFQVSEKDLHRLDVEGNYLPGQASEAVKALTTDIENFLHTTLKASVYGFAGTAGTAPLATDVSEYADTRKTANTQLMPKDGRIMLIDEDAEANAIQLRAFQDASFGGGNDVMGAGMIGNKMGADWRMSTLVPSHTAVGTGTITINDASVSVGDTSLTWDGGGTQPVAGDIFTVAGDTQTYVVNSATATTITMFPSAQVAWADDAALTFKATHVKNVLYHPDVMAFAMAPLANEGDAQAATAIDEASGLALRVVRSVQHRQVRYAYDALYGAVVVRPEYGVIMAG